MDQGIDVRSDDYQDDPSSALGLSHSATGRGTGGIQRIFDEQLREHKAAMRAEMQRQGVTDIAKLQMINAGAYDDPIARQRARELQAEGYCLSDAEKMARDEAEQRRLSGEPAPPTDRDREREYLGDSVESLMRPEALGDVHGGSKHGGKMKRKQRLHGRGADDGAYVLASYSVGDGRCETIEAQPRDRRRTLRLSEMTEAELNAIESESGINLPGLAAAIAVLRRRNDPAARDAVRTLLLAAPQRA